MTQAHHSSDLITALTSNVVSSYTKYNRVSAKQLNALTSNMRETFIELCRNIGGTHETLLPAVAISDSINPDYIICLEDGKPLKNLKRHLRAYFNMTPHEYRAKWGLAADYPMTAPNYAKRRSEIAKQIRLGHIGARQAHKAATDASAPADGPAKPSGH